MLNCNEFVNADEIARGLSPFQPETVAIQAGKIMLNRIDELISQHKDFAIETTLTTKSYLNTIKKAQEIGYHVTMLFFWLNDVELAIERVNIRVSEGGHRIPEETVRRRYEKGIRNLELFMALIDYWLIVDNSTNKPLPIAEGNFKEESTIFDKDKWRFLNRFTHESK